MILQRFEMNANSAHNLLSSTVNLIGLSIPYVLDEAINWNNRVQKALHQAYVV